MSKSRTPLADQVRAAIRQGERAGITRYRLSKQSGVAASVLSRIMHGTSSPTPDTIDKIVRGLGKNIFIL